MQTLDEKVRSDYLRKLFIDMANVKALLKPYKGIRATVIKDTDEQEIYKSLIAELRHLRLAIQKFDYRDPLAIRKAIVDDRKREENSGKRTIEIYENEDRSRVSYSPFEDDNDLKVKEVVRHVNCIVFAKKCGTQDSIWDYTQSYSSLFFWKDNFMEHFKSNGKVELFQKTKYFRLGDMYYLWGKYFPFQGKAYDRSKWGLFENELKDLSKFLLVTSDTSRASGRMPVRWYKKRFCLEAPAGDEFILKEPSESFLRIRLRIERTFADGLASANFFWSMFKNKNKRFFTNDKLWINLTKEDCIDLEFAPSANHRTLFGDMLMKYQRYCSDKGCPNEGSLYYAEALGRKFNDAISFEVEYIGPDVTGKSIKAQVLQEIFPPNNFYRPIELKARLKALSDILKEEDKYANNKRKKNNNF